MGDGLERVLHGGSAIRCAPDNCMGVARRNDHNHRQYCSLLQHGHSILVMTRRILKLATRAFALACAGWNWNSTANPSGLKVVAGSATAKNTGSHLNVTASNGAVLNWNSFNIGKGQTTTFIQPSAN